MLDQRARCRPYVDGKRLERMVLRHLDGTRNYTVALHRLLALELLQKRLIEAEPSSPISFRMSHASRPSHLVYE